MVGLAQRPADPYLDTRTDTPRQVWGRSREVLSCLQEPGRHNCQAEESTADARGPPTTPGGHSLGAEQLPFTPVAALRPPSRLPPLETWDTPRLTDCAFLLHLVSLRVTKPGRWWKSREDPQPSLGSWCLRGHWSQRVCSFVSTSPPVGVQY